MKLFNSLKNIIDKLYVSLKRFPLTILFSMSTVILLIIISEVIPADDTLRKAAMVLALGIPLSLNTKLYLENNYKSKPFTRILFYVSNIFLLILYYVLFMGKMDMVSTTRYIAVSIALYLSFIFIPYLPIKENFERYVIILFSGFFLTFIYSAVLYGGLSAILFAFDKLIGIRVLSKVYYYTFLIVAFVFAVSYFLSLIPSRKDDLNTRSYPKALRILLLYIVMPLLTVYTMILYIYLGKIIATKIWPVGMVSNLVLWYSVILTAVLFLITPLINTNKWADKFFKLFPKIILPILIMMFISIGIRVNAYGVTERRYYVILLAIWVLCIMIYFAITRKLKNIVLPITLCLLCIISVFGPLSSYSISKLSQSNRLEKILIKNNMLSNGNIKSSPLITNKDKVNISSILSYFNTNHSLKDIKYLPNNFTLEDMNNIFGFPYEYLNNEASNGSFYFSRNQSDNGIDIQGYDYMFDMRTINGSGNSGNNPIKTLYNYETSEVKILKDGKTIYTKNLNLFAQDIINKHGFSPKNNMLASDEMTLIEENENLKVKFIFLSISGNMDSSNKLTDAKGIEFYLLIKLK